MLEKNKNLWVTFCLIGPDIDIEKEAAIIRKADENLETQNLIKTIEFVYDGLCNQKVISIHLVNRMHEILLNSVRGAEKTPGRVRTTQN